jgi:hypothetical protein
MMLHHLTGLCRLMWCLVGLTGQSLYPCRVIYSTASLPGSNGEATRGECSYHSYVTKQISTHVHVHFLLLLTPANT